MIKIQNIKDFEIILVDNKSTDATIETAKRLGIRKILNIEKYLPGKALNTGIKVAEGDIIVCLSAHCMPKDEFWLENLISPLENHKIAGVYGRQIPTSFSNSSNKRDLIITFGIERRLQTRDYFFHNANSAFRRELWKQYPFNEETTNIEDRIWAKKIIEKGYHILYEPEAIIYHYHGIHQNRNDSRSITTAKVLSIIEDDEILNSLPKSMLPENIKTVAICPIVNSNPLSNDHIEIFKDMLADLEPCSYLNEIYVLASHTVNRVKNFLLIKK